jgi:hypothetical protein
MMKLFLIAAIPLLHIAACLPSNTEVAKRGDSAGILRYITTMANDTVALDNLVLASKVDIVAFQKQEQILEKDIVRHSKPLQMKLDAYPLIECHHRLFFVNSGHHRSRVYEHLQCLQERPTCQSQKACSRFDRQKGEIQCGQVDCQG